MDKEQEIPGLEEIDRLVREDIDLGRAIQEKVRARDMRVRMVAQKMREVAEPFDRELAPLQKKRQKLRDSIFALWRKVAWGKTTLDLPAAKVSRRNYRELVVKDKAAVLAALDKADRLDLVDQVLDESAVARLIAEGKLAGLPERAAQVIDHLNLQVRTKGKKGESDVADPCEDEGEGVPAEA